MVILFLFLAFLLAFTSMYTHGIPRNIIQLIANLFLVLFFWVQAEKTLFPLIGCALFTISTTFKVVGELKEERTSRNKKKVN